jgi:hypothetical protein
MVVILILWIRCDLRVRAMNIQNTLTHTRTRFFVCVLKQISLVGVHISLFLRTRRFVAVVIKPVIEPQSLTCWIDSTSSPLQSPIYTGRHPPPPPPTAITHFRGRPWKFSDQFLNDLCWLRISPMSSSLSSPGYVSYTWWVRMVDLAALFSPRALSYVLTFLCFVIIFFSRCRSWDLPCWETNLMTTQVGKCVYGADIVVRLIYCAYD